MKTMFKKSRFFVLLLSIGVSVLSSCGGGGSGAVESGDYLSSGTNLKFIFTGGSNSGRPYALDVVSSGTGMAYMTWQGHETVSGYAAYSMRKVSDTVSVFTTAFNYVEGSHIIAGPQVVSPIVKVSVEATMYLPEGINNTNYASQTHNGPCSYLINIRGYKEGSSSASAEKSNTYRGETGKYVMSPVAF